MSDYDAHQALADAAAKRAAEDRAMRLMGIKPIEEFPPVNAKSLLIVTAVIVLAALASALWPMGWAV